MHITFVLYMHTCMIQCAAQIIRGVGCMNLDQHISVYMCMHRQTDPVSR